MARIVAFPMDSPRQLASSLRSSLKQLGQSLEHGLRALRSPRDSGEAGGVTAQEDLGFQDLLEEFGVEEEESALETQLRLAQNTIEELQRNLLELQPMGDMLAEAEQARIALLQELDGLKDEGRSRVSQEELREELDQAHRDLTARDKKLARLEDRLDRWRTKYEERNRVASDRWRELQSVRREKRELEKELSRRS